MIAIESHGETRPTESNASSAPVIRSLSAVVSRNEPSRELTFQRRASRPSNQSVLATRTKTIADAIQAWSRISAITTGVAKIRRLVPARISALARALPLLARSTAAFDSPLARPPRARGAASAIGASRGPRIIDRATGLHGERRSYSCFRVEDRVQAVLLPILLAP